MAAHHRNLSVHYELITTDQQLTEFCLAISKEPLIAFDTEFVSEDSYRPELCLVQVAAGEHRAVIDPLALTDMTPFWHVLAAPGHQTVVHAGREEFRFCRFAIQQRPAALFDIQLAAGLAGLEYPASYAALVSRLVNKSVEKGETRTDWRRRPLSDSQLEYAMQDVLHLEPAFRAINRRLEKLGRTAWLPVEMDAWQQEVEQSEDGERWRRVTGIANLPPRMLAIVRELWHWRDGEAARRNWPVKRVLRDDLIVELARRQTTDPKRILAVRGLERGDIQRQMPKLIECIERAMALPPNEHPRPPRRAARPQLNVLGQFLNTALGSVCREANVAPSLVGTVEDVRDLIAYRLGVSEESTIPALATGWRAEIVGHVIEELLAGKLVVRITDPLSDTPLSFVPLPKNESDEALSNRG